MKIKDLVLVAILGALNLVVSMIVTFALFPLGPYAHCISPGIAGLFAGLAGALLAHQYTYIDPTIFTSTMSTLFLTIIVLGGMNSPLGAVIGSIILIGLPEVLRFASTWRGIVYGFLLVIIILFRPQGLWSRTVGRSGTNSKKASKTGKNRAVLAKENA